MSPPSSCPASAVILAARQSRTPLAIATSPLPHATLVFANDAFAELLECIPAALVGRRIDALGTRVVVPLLAHGVPARLELANGNPVALSTAAVRGPDSSPACLLCSLIDARGDAAEAAIAREAVLLSEIAQAAGDLMRASSAAARIDQGHEASAIAFDAVAHATQAEAQAQADGRA